jgi:hypothetical protein
MLAVNLRQLKYFAKVTEAGDERRLSRRTRPICK